VLDRGARLLFQQAQEWSAGQARAGDAFSMIRDHVLLHHASRLRDVDESMACRLEPEVVSEIVGWVPESWLVMGEGRDAVQLREAYTRYLLERVRAPRAFLLEALGAD